MKNIRRLILFMLLMVLMVAPVFLSPQASIAATTTTESDAGASGGVRIVDIGNGESIELAPNEELHRFILSDQGWTEWTGFSDPLIGSEFGNSTNVFSSRQMKYTPGSGTTTVQTGISLGTSWEAYRAQVGITSLTENRTWITNPGFDGGYTGWTAPRKDMIQLRYE